MGSGLMRNYFVTGCTSGVGLRLTLELIRRGACVYGVALDSVAPEPLRTASETGRLHYWACDVSRPDQVRSSVKKMESDGFEPDVIILNAGINPERNGGDFSLERFEQVMRVNVS